MNKPTSNKRGTVTYQSYSFVDKDPIIDQLRTVLANDGASYTEVHERSDVSISTLYNWFDGKTRRPQFATAMAVARSLGYDLKLTKMRGSHSATVVPLRKAAAR